MKSHICPECGGFFTRYNPFGHNPACPNRPDRPEEYDTDEDWAAALKDDKDAEDDSQVEAEMEKKEERA